MDREHIRYGHLILCIPCPRHLWFILFHELMSFTMADEHSLTFTLCLKKTNTENMTATTVEISSS